MSILYNEAQSPLTHQLVNCDMTQEEFEAEASIDLQ